MFETTTDVVEEQLKNGQLQLVEKANAKSEVWAHMGVVSKKKSNFQQQV